MEHFVNLSLNFKFWKGKMLTWSIIRLAAKSLSAVKDNENTSSSLFKLEPSYESHEDLLAPLLAISKVLA
jgi:hypothetical protein